jgi:sugar phosphate isomerase/epimerase
MSRPDTKGTHLFSGTRRGFLGTVAAATAAGAVWAEESANPWRPRWILASALYGPFSLKEILPEVRKTGAAMIDLWPKPHGTQREEVDSLGADRVREMLAAAEVTLGGIACYMVGPFNLAGEFAVATRLGAAAPTLVTMAPGDGGLRGDALIAAIKAFLEKLRPSIAAAEEAGGVIAIENHSHSLLQSPEGIRRFAELAAHERVGVALAPHHLPQDGELVAAIARDLGPKLKFVYAQQHGKGSKEKLPKADELSQMPGRGPLDFGPLMRELAAMRFDGPVEIFMHPVPRGVPILESIDQITAEVNLARDHLVSAGADPRPTGSR